MVSMPDVTSRRLERAVARQLQLSFGRRARKATRGRGVQAQIEGHTVLVGQPTWLAEKGIDAQAAEQDLADLREQGKTVMLVAVEGTVAGLIAVAGLWLASALSTRPISKMGSWESNGVPVYSIYPIL